MNIEGKIRKEEAAENGAKRSIKKTAELTGDEIFFLRNECLEGPILVRRQAP